MGLRSIPKRWSDESPSLKIRKCPFFWWQWFCLKIWN